MRSRPDIQNKLFFKTKYIIAHNYHYVFHRKPSNTPKTVYFTLTKSCVYNNNASCMFPLPITSPFCSIRFKIVHVNSLLRAREPSPTILLTCGEKYFMDKGAVRSYSRFWRQQTPQMSTVSSILKSSCTER